ncbi:hypothetical protein [Halovivax sp.]|uniref:hypothetical protein n=1 Tax=Halovivax sp. TaxID=1935978 RepID=UPI0025B8A62C|nr:hypothetical protein [Halovivax sp.]
MQEPSRRTLIGAAGSTALLAAAGCLSLDDGGDDEIVPDDDRFETVLESLPAEFDDPAWLWVTDVEAMSVLEEEEAAAFELWIVHPDDEEAYDPSRVATAIGDEYGMDGFVSVAIGSFDPDADDDLTHLEDRDDYDLYVDESAGEDDYVAVEDDVLVAASEEELAEGAFGAIESKDDRLIAEIEAVEHASDALGHADAFRVSLQTDELTDELDVDPDDVRYWARTTTAVDEDTLEVAEILECTDEDVPDETLATALADADGGWFGDLGGREGPDVEIDGATIAATIEVDLREVREQDDHQSPRIGAADGRIDLDEDVVELEVRDGDPTPIEELELTVNDETYDPDVWANGASEIAEGDRLQIETNDVEPNTSVQLRHEHAFGSSSSGTTLLGNLQFEFEFDEDATRLTIEYVDEYELDGDELHVARVDGDHRRRHEREDEGPDELDRPWAGEQVSDGSTATIDAERGQSVYVSYGSDDEFDAVAWHEVRPPGRIESTYHFEDGTLDVTLSVDRTRSADGYAIEIGRGDDARPADGQFSDETDVVEDEVSVTLSDVEFGDHVVVAWREATVGFASAVPDAEFALSADDETLEYVDGPDLTLDDLEITAWNENHEEREIDVEASVDDPLEPGDEVGLDVPDLRHVSVSYRDSSLGGVVVEE